MQHEEILEKVATQEQNCQELFLSIKLLKFVIGIPVGIVDKFPLSTSKVNTCHPSKMYAYIYYLIQKTTYKYWSNCHYSPDHY